MRSEAHRSCLALNLLVGRDGGCLKPARWMSGGANPGPGTHSHGSAGAVFEDSGWLDPAESITASVYVRSRHCDCESHRRQIVAGNQYKGSQGLQPFAGGHQANRLMLAGLPAPINRRRRAVPVRRDCLGVRALPHQGDQADGQRVENDPQREPEPAFEANALVAWLGHCFCSRSMAPSASVIDRPSRRRSYRSVTGSARGTCRDSFGSR